MNDNDKLTLSQIADLISHGHNGLIANLDYETLQETVEEWKNQRSQDLEVIRQLPNLEEFVTITTEYDHKKEEEIASRSTMANNVVQMADSDSMITNFKMIDEFSEDFFQNFIEKIRNLQEESSLTKKQFMAYLMKTNNKKGITISRTLDVNEGTVSSHVSRAKEKIETSKKTARVDELTNKENYHELRDKRREMLFS